MEKKTLNVEDMSCEHCVKAVTKALKNLPGTAKVAVDLKAKTASFEYNPAKISLKKIEAAIVDAGYTVSS